MAVLLFLDSFSYCVMSLGVKAGFLHAFKLRDEFVVFKVKRSKSCGQLAPRTKKDVSVECT